MVQREGVAAFFKTHDHLYTMTIMIEFIQFQCNRENSHTMYFLEAFEDAHKLHMTSFYNTIIKTWNLEEKSFKKNI